MDNNNSVDVNIDNYNISELFAILDLDPSSDKMEIIEKTNYYIKTFQYENKPEMYNFFKKIQSKLVEYVNNDEKSRDKESEQWYHNEPLPQTNTTQIEKITDRKNQTEVYEDDHVPMNRKQLGVSNNYNVPVAQDTLNPKLENVITRFINLDSQFRQATNVVENSSTDYTLDLSEPLNNVLSMRLFSLQIPYSWYTIDTVYGNTCFWLVFNSDYMQNVQISISPGNYTPSELVDVLTTSISSPASYISSSSFPTTTVSYNKNNGRITLNLYGGIYTNSTTTTSYTIDTTTQIVFFDAYNTGQLNSKTSTNNNPTTYNKNSTSTCNISSTINQTLGWVMGYHLPFYYVSTSGNEAVTPVDLYGTKYLILSIDDYNQNHINNGLVGITELSNNLKLPSYYNSSIPYVCPTPPTSNNLDVNSAYIQGDNGDLLMEKMNITYKKIPQVIPSIPRTLTQAQLYSINEIMKNNGKNTNFRSRAPTTTDTFAIMPIKHGRFTTGETYVEFSGSLQYNKRTYFGPVNIDRMRIRLLDDKGNVINMNGADWSVILISEILYQY